MLSGYLIPDGARRAVRDSLSGSMPGNSLDGGSFHGSQNRSVDPYEPKPTSNGTFQILKRKRASLGGTGSRRPSKMPRF